MDGATKPLSILIVEDSPDDADLLLLELRRAGMQVRSQRVDTGPAMRAAMQADRYDLILCDHTMPAFDSQGALAIARELGEDIPFIIVSGTLGEEYAVAAMRAGCHDYIIKGNLKRLAPAVERELREAEVRRARHRAEKDLQHTTNILNNILASASEFAIVAIDLENRVIHCNPAAELLLGARADDVIGHPVEETTILRTITSENLTDILETVNEHGKWVCECQSSNPSGTRHLRSIVMPMRDETGTGIGCILFASDVTAQKEAERQQRQLEAELQQAQKLESLGVMAGGIAHDFNNLLSIIRGNIELLAMSIGHAPAGRVAIDNIQTATEHATALTRGLQAFSRPSRKETRIVDANTIVQEAYNLVHRVLPHGIQFERLPDPAPCPISADSVQIQQVLINLCVNARDAMAGSGRLTIETRRVSDEDLTLSAREKLDGRQFVRIRVTDTGCGMSPEVLARVFDPFFTTKPKDMGTGLGLAMVYRIVQAHHGAVEVVSAPAQGTRFDVLLPMQEQTAAAPAPPSPPRQLAPARVIVAVGQEMIAGLLQTLLEKRGCPPFICRSGKDALEIAATGAQTVALAIIGHDLPDMTGIDCLRRLQEAHPETKGILLAGANDPLNSDRPSIQIIREPCTVDTIVERAREMLAG